MIKYLIERYLVKAFCEEIKYGLPMYKCKREYQMRKDGDCYVVIFKSTQTHYDNSHTTTHRKLIIIPRQLLFLTNSKVSNFIHYIDGREDSRALY